MKTLILLGFSMTLLLLGSCAVSGEKQIVFESPDNISIFVDKHADSLLLWAANDVSANLSLVLGVHVDVVLTSAYEASAKGIYVGGYQDALVGSLPRDFADALSEQWESYFIDGDKKQLFVVGSDVRGAVYGLFELAERLGISPWDWWADVKPLPCASLAIDLPQQGEFAAPSVRYRGVFLNDEDWGLQPWSAKTFEPEVGDIGPRSYEKIFQLLLKLKANTIWPAMHPCTHAFYSIEGNRQMAEKYHILIGTSHAEPMLRNNVDEWDKKRDGDFNYFNNREKVKAYWRSRIDDTKTGEQIYTLGMRGIHDSGMRGGSSRAESVSMLDTIIMDQRAMLCDARKQAIVDIPQVLVPYKEVLDLYNAGLQVPEDVTLMWTDDNYGYIRRQSTVQEQKRSGGAGVYYHISYWGRPHDYLWLSTTQPGLIWFEMSRAYHNGAQDMWIVNVGDIKPAEYNMEFFLDLAWDIHSMDHNSIETHLQNWCQREFGHDLAAPLSEVFTEYYRLAMLRKPEYMGWSTTEPTTPTRNSGFTSHNDNELQRRIEAYAKLSATVKELRASVPDERADAYFQLVTYPVLSAALINHKFLYAHQANTARTQERFEVCSQKANAAYDSIVRLTQQYNQEIAGGKWQYMMSMNPRRLPVFNRPQMAFSGAATAQLGTQSTIKPIFINANNFTDKSESETYTWASVQSLGYSQNSMTLFPLKTQYFEKDQPYLEYTFQVDKVGDYSIELRCLPTHANDFNHQICLELNDEKFKVHSINTKGRSEAWKHHVLQNYVSVKQDVTIAKVGRQRLRVYVSHSGIVLDQLAINPKDYGGYYEIPK